MMDPILGAFEKRLRSIAFQPPRIPWLSNVSGTWIKAEEATDPAYWARHIRSTVRFSDCLAELLRKPEQIFIEVGPGNVLTSLARQQGGGTAKAFQSLPHPRETVSGLRCALANAGPALGFRGQRRLGEAACARFSPASFLADLSFRTPEVLD